MESYLKGTGERGGESGSPRESVPWLSLHRFAVGVGAVPLLRAVNLIVQPGELVALAGPSGCGKTTLLRAVAGLISPLAGEMRLKGMRPEELGWPQYRRNVVLVDQQPVLVGQTVRANLERPFSYQVAACGFPAGRAGELLERLGLESGRMAQEAHSLSLGQQQRVCLARALLVEPAVLLLDEPTSALDEDAVTAVEGLVRKEASSGGLAALIVTHNRQQAKRWCDRTLDLTALMVSGKTRKGVGALANG